ncbi:MAG: hypothetical protein KAI43_13525 [Candidatus Aureabacteria bacterium]|nr:hypothetical protein [Candidatus Auribacterota bacterium]
MKRAVKPEKNSRNTCKRSNKLSFQKVKEDFLFYYKRGLEWSQKGVYDLALADFTHSISLKDDFAKAYYGRAAVYNALKEFDKAKKDFFVSHTLLSEVRFTEDSASKN